jgi:hypothetical protein
MGELLLGNRKERFQRLIQRYCDCLRSNGSSEASLRPRQFDDLLRSFGKAFQNRETKITPLAADLGRLINNFREAKARSLGAELRWAKDAGVTFSSLLQTFHVRLDAWEMQPKSTAENFNVLGILGLQSRELCHSRIIAWLLDWKSHRFGTHGQGSLGFRLFLEALGLDTTWAQERYLLRTEVTGACARTDLEISQSKRFIISIENKIWAQEGIDQTEREWRDMHERAKRMNVHPDNRVALFLTPRGHSPGCKGFRVLTWQTMADIFEQFGELAQPIEVKQFAHHYANIVRDKIIPDYDIPEERTNGEEVV